MKTKMTINDAARKWVGEFNAIPQAIITKAYTNLDEFEILATDLECTYCGCTEGTHDEEMLLVCDSCGHSDWENKWGLPMWGTMWTFGSSFDEAWARENVEIMRDCGFWVYESEELGVFFGIDGAGYDFYEAHWIPLYKARGLRWHDAEGETA